MQVKYWAPGPRFNSRKFAAMLQDIGVDCKPVPGGVVIDRTKFNSIPETSLPAWARKNKASINNPLCTAEVAE